jgi:hypothetical protein
MLRRVALVRTNVSEDSVASIIRASRTGEQRTLTVTSNRNRQRTNGSDTFLRNVGFYKSRTA